MSVAEVGRGGVQVGRVGVLGLPGGFVEHALEIVAQALVDRGDFPNRAVLQVVADRHDGFVEEARNAGVEAVGRQRPAA